MFTKKMFDNFRSDVKEALAGIEEKYGVDLKITHITYETDGSGFNAKLEAVKSVEGKSIEQIKFEKYAELFGFKDSDYGRTFIYNNKEFKIVEIKTKNTRYPIIAEDKDKHKYKFPAEDVRVALNK